MADIMEWSFQAKLDEVCMHMIGTKKVGPRPTPMLDNAIRMLNDHKAYCEGALKRTDPVRVRLGPRQPNYTGMQRQNCLKPPEGGGK